MYKDFEDFLQEKCAEANPMVLDDGLPDCYADWMGELEQDDLIEYADMYGRLKKIDGKKEMLDEFSEFTKLKK